MRARFECSADDRIPTIAAEMDIWTVDGKKHALSTQAARGSSSNPLKDAEIEGKLRDEARRWEPDHDIQPLIDAVWALDRSEDVSALLRLAVPTRR